MVIKKFIKRRGKIFGPYYYLSKREGDKVRKIYIGGEEEYREWLRKTSKKTPWKSPVLTKNYYTPIISHKKTFLAVFIAVFLLIALLFSANFIANQSEFNLRLVGSVIAGNETQEALIN